MGKILSIRGCLIKGKRYMTMDETREILEVFDSRNRLIGRATRGSIHRWGLRHRAVHVFVLDLAGSLYLQLRQAHKDRFPRHWDSSAAGHVSPGESYDAAARRELEEELGIREEVYRLAEVAASSQTGWEHVVLFHCRTQAALRPNPEEIEAGAFFPLGEIDRMLADPQWPFTPAFRGLYHLWRTREHPFL